VASYPTLHEVRSATEEYWQIWEELLNQVPELRRIVGQHSPTALGWKVEGDVAPLEAAERLFELGDSIFATAVDRERSILTVRKGQAVALDTLQEIEIIQRRPSKPDDELGPDNLVLMLPHGLPEIEKVSKVAGKADVTVELQGNEAHEWISITYQGHEFKLMDHQIWDICVHEAASLIGLSIKKN
jgi:hypothetical protein